MKHREDNNQILYNKVCTDLELHLKKFLAYRVSRLAVDGSLKRLYHHIRTKLSVDRTVPTLVDEDGVRYRTDSDKATALASHFVKSFSSPPQNNVGLQTHVPPRSARADALYFHPEEIASVLRSMKTSLSEPYDGIP